MYYAIDADLTVKGFEVKSDRKEFVQANELRRSVTRNEARKMACAMSNGEVYDEDLNVIHRFKDLAGW